MNHGRMVLKVVRNQTWHRTKPGIAAVASAMAVHWQQTHRVMLQRAGGPADLDLALLLSALYCIDSSWCAGPGEFCTSSLAVHQNVMGVLVQRRW